MRYKYLCMTGLIVFSLSACGENTPSADSAPQTHAAESGSSDAAEPPESKTNSLFAVPKSTTELDVSALNERIRDTDRESGDWLFSPSLLVQHLYGGDLAFQGLLLAVEKNSVEQADAATVRMQQMGGMDDSIQDVYRQLELELADDGTWQISSGEVAYRCARGDNTEDFQGALCP